jgi:hypothetical protein
MPASMRNMVFRSIREAEMKGMGDAGNDDAREQKLQALTEGLRVG